nr:hypothetical protein [Hassalia byssoidea]
MYACSTLPIEQKIHLNSVSLETEESDRNIDVGFLGRGYRY